MEKSFTSWHHGGERPRIWSEAANAVAFSCGPAQFYDAGMEQVSSERTFQHQRKMTKREKRRGPEHVVQGVIIMMRG